MEVFSPAIRSDKLYRFTLIGYTHRCSVYVVHRYSLAPEICGPHLSHAPVHITCCSCAALLLQGLILKPITTRLHVPKKQQKCEDSD